ncbi:anti-sigma-factor antagonist [Spirochaeta thermophila DSM 6578]|uniref:Anti-sigma factor antagonist n=1 Tax=Winmispira thermophila (strain ATCC 700085 / DSM 6578 / Z-1203) TaxID=869211 RepID=G0GA46_WINT7|nr:STAS domain-containing protein [Spirochaeta thermophila]AEJ61734.1 anti-sigma-factor antagonist [Spirochaeta thermophila DSM 6578]
MDIDVTREKHSFILSLTGELDLYQAPRIKDMLQKVFPEHPAKIVLDLDGLTYIDSSGIGALLYAYSEAKRRDIAFYLVNLHGSVKRVIELTKLLHYFPIAPSLEEALHEEESSADPSEEMTFTSPEKSSP